MKILVGNRDNVDFDEPIEMTEEQYNKFVSFMNTIYKVIDTKEPEEINRQRMGERFFSKHWTDEELDYILMPTLTTEELSEMLGRTWMSVNMKRGWHMADFQMWCKQKGYNIFKDDVKNIIKEFRKERIDLRAKEKEEQRRKKQSEKDLNYLVDKGCVVTTKVYGDECLNGFHKGCFACPHSQHKIKNQTDIDRFNQALEDMSEE